MPANVVDSVEIKDVATVYNTKSENHQDEGMRVLDGYDGAKEWTQEEESNLRRRVDWKLMPILCFTYGLQYYDKAMLGQAVSFKMLQ